MRRGRLLFAGFCALVCAAGLGVSGGKARADDDLVPGAKRVIIGIDLSSSNPLVEDQPFANRVAKRVGALIANLVYSSEVAVRTFGDYTTSSNQYEFNVLLSTYKNRTPVEVATYVANAIGSTPKMVRSGRWKAQKSTNILAFIDTAVQSIGCSRRKPTTILLLTDGLEDSEYAKLIHPGDHLPLPGRPKYKGCAELQILGLGQGAHSPRTTERLRAEWERWARAAGFERFVGLNDW